MKLKNKIVSYVLHYSLLGMFCHHEQKYLSIGRKSMNTSTIRYVTNSALIQDIFGSV